MREEDREKEHWWFPPTQEGPWSSQESGSAGQVAPAPCLGPPFRSYRDSGQGCEDRTPISPAGSLRDRDRVLLTQPVMDTVLTWGQQGGWGENPNCFLRGTQCLVPQKPLCGKVGHGPIG